MRGSYKRRSKLLPLTLTLSPREKAWGEGMKAPFTERIHGDDAMAATIEITGIRIRRAMAPVRRVLNTRVGRFTKGPFLLIDLELKGGGVGRALVLHVHARSALKVVPILLEELVAAVKGPQDRLRRGAGQCTTLGQKRLTHIGPRGRRADGALHVRHGPARRAGARGRRAALRAAGRQREPLPTYHSCGLGLMAPADVAREAKEMVVEHGGFTHMKLRMGRERCGGRGRRLQGRAQRRGAGHR